MSNEELAVAIRAGERDKLMELWGQVRRLVHDMAYKRLRATNGAGGVTLDDLMQAGFLGFLEAVRAYDPSAGFRFTSYLTYPVKSAFSEAEGRRSEKQKRDPIFSAVEGLPEGQKEEIRRRYWLNQTTAEISTATGVPEKEVRKLEAAALRALRHPRISRGLRAYM